MDRQKLMGKGLWKLMLKDDEDLSKLTIKVRLPPSPRLFDDDGTDYLLFIYGLHRKDQ